MSENPLVGSTARMVAILRNPGCYSTNDVIAARLEAADLIEQLRDECRLLRHELALRPMTASAVNARATEYRGPGAICILDDISAFLAPAEEPLEGAT